MSTPYQEYYNVRLNKKNKNDGNTYITFIRHNLILIEWFKNCLCDNYVYKGILIY